MNALKCNLTLDSPRKAKKHAEYLATYRSDASGISVSGCVVCWDQEINPQIVCPHCGQAGFVSSTLSKQKLGTISPAKATGAVITAGFSLLATGLAKKGYMTEMHCYNCRTIWHVS